MYQTACYVLEDTEIKDGNLVKKELIILLKKTDKWTITI